jgi:hypothetical protein
MTKVTSSKGTLVAHLFDLHPMSAGLRSWQREERVACDTVRVYLLFSFFSFFGLEGPFSDPDLATAEVA